MREVLDARITLKVSYLKIDLVVKNARIISPRGILEGGIAVEGGVIVAIAKDPHLPQADRVIDAGG